VAANTVGLEELAEVQASLRALATAHWTAHALHAALSLGLFTCLESGPKSLDDIVQALGADARAARSLLSSMASIGLVEVAQGRYALSEVSRQLLLPGSPYYQGDLIAMYARGAQQWLALEDSIRTGKPAPRPTQHDDTFIRSMRNSASVCAPLVAAQLDLSRVRRVLDVGGGPGSYAVALAQRKADLHADVLDLAAARAPLAETAAAAGLSDRIHFIEGDFHEVSFGDQPYDMVLFSNILHSYPKDTCSALLAKAFAALVPEAPCVVHEMLVTDSYSVPLLPSLFGLNMLLNSSGGTSYSAWECTDMMQSVGFIRMQVVPLTPTPGSLVIGFHP
jgi:SAM-dependent methyltransferase